MSSLSHHLPYHEVLSALEKRTCALCSLVKDAVFRYLSGLCYESLNDVTVREQLRKSLGFCPYHAWELGRLGSRLGIALLYQDLLSELEEGLHQMHQAPSRGEAFRKKIHPCPACEIQAQAEERYLSVLEEHLGEKELQDRYARSKGLCFPHLYRLWKRVGPKLRDFLYERELAHLNQLQSELAEVIRKHDYRFSREGWGEEKDAPGRALFKVSGQIGCIAEEK